MTSRKERWSGAATIAVMALSVAWVFSSFAGCEAQVTQARYDAQVEIQKTQIEYDKWLLENGHGKLQDR